MIQRRLLSIIKKKLFKGKAVILLVSRQAGKTTLTEKNFAPYHDIPLILSGGKPGIDF